MASRASVSVLAFALVAMGLFAPATAKPATACTEAALSLEQTAQLADLVVVGEVVGRSTVLVVATFKGTAPTELTNVGPSEEMLRGNPNTDCDPPPTLRPGPSVVLFLYRDQVLYRDQDGIGIYRQHGQYALASGHASPGYGPPVPDQAFLRYIAAITDAPDDQLDIALAFARGELQAEPAPEVGALPEVAEEEGGPPALVIGIASAGAAIALLALLFAARRLQAR